MITSTKRITVAEARERLAEVGVTIRRTLDREYRVSLKGVDEPDASAYYTGDLEDAVGTGLDMAKRRDEALLADKTEIEAAERAVAPSLGEQPAGL